MWTAHRDSYMVVAGTEDTLDRAVVVLSRDYIRWLEGWVRWGLSQ